MRLHAVAIPLVLVRERHVAVALVAVDDLDDTSCQLGVCVCLVVAVAEMFRQGCSRRVRRLAGLEGADAVALDLVVGHIPLLHRREVTVTLITVVDHLV